MKNYWLIFLFISVSGFGQLNDKEQILHDSELFVQALEKREFDTFLDLMYPAAFDYFDRETFKEIIETAYFGNEEFSLEIIELDRIKFEVSEIYTDIPDVQYAFVHYPLTMKMVFFGEEMDDEKKNVMRKSMEIQGNEIEFPNNNTVISKMQSITIAMKDEKTKGKWRYTNYDEESAFLPMVLPVEVLKKAKNLRTDLLYENAEKKK